MVSKTARQFMLPIVLFVSVLVSSGWCEEMGVAPVPLQAALFLKLLAFDKNIASGGTVTIYVIGAPEFAAEMKKTEGKPVGTATLGKVIEGDGVPSEKPSVIYIGTDAKLSEILVYTKSNKILSITGNPTLVSKDVSLVVGISEAKPKIMLNLTSSKDEGIDWNPAILKVAATMK
jgi:hypothetical protein